MVDFRARRTYLCQRDEPSDSFIIFFLSRKKKEAFVLL